MKTVGISGKLPKNADSSHHPAFLLPVSSEVADKLWMQPVLSEHSGYPLFWIVLSFYNALFHLGIQGCSKDSPLWSKNDFRVDVIIHEGTSAFKVVNAELSHVPGWASDLESHGFCVLNSWKLWECRAWPLWAVKSSPPIPKLGLVPASWVPRCAPQQCARLHIVADFFSSANQISEPL